ncbi:MAG: phage protein [Paenibacillaceae bacterium]|jgi:hypothetical protein|nr:phage protein [Paenibacillaceae bacterium]
MIPTGGQLAANPAAATIEQPSRTWRLDFDQGRISGMIDDREAVLQAVYKILQTERYVYLAYSFDYGFEGRNLIGRSPSFVRSELRRRISEALLQDSRVQEVRDFSFESKGDTMLVRFTVVTSTDRFEQEVSIHV